MLLTQQTLWWSLISTLTSSMQLALVVYTTHSRYWHTYFYLRRDWHRRWAKLCWRTPTLHWMLPLETWASLWSGKIFFCHTQKLSNIFLKYFLTSWVTARIGFTILQYTRSTSTTLMQYTYVLYGNSYKVADVNSCISIRSSCWEHRLFQRL